MKLRGDYTAPETGEWHRWFAWHPVTVGTRGNREGIRWLQRVWRRWRVEWPSTGGHADMWYLSYWEYTTSERMSRDSARGAKQ